MGLPVTHVRLDPKFFDSMRPGESVTSRLNQIISRYAAIIKDESDLFDSDWATEDEWAWMRKIAQSLSKSGLDPRAHRHQFSVALNDELMGEGIGELSLSEYIALLERLERCVAAEGGAA